MLQLKARGPRWFDDQLLAVVIAIVAPPVPTVVVVARAVVAVVFDALGPSSSLDGVPGVTVRPESTPYRQCCVRDSFPLSLLLRRRWIRTMGRWCSGSPVLRPLS
jgi:hypothetical protein